MGYSARILADSLNPVGVRLTSFEITYPRIIIAELNTHRMLSKSTASSRAIPVSKMIKRVKADPFLPVHWGRNQKGMQAAAELTGLRLVAARALWILASRVAIWIVRLLSLCGLHKQVANRLLEPFSWVTTVVTATDWENMLNLRDHENAQPEFRILARMIREALATSTPR